VGLNVALSFSGGKDSCLALYQLQQQGIDVVCLLTTIWKDSLQTVAHDEALELIEGQAKRLNIPVHFVETDFSTYREDFVNALHNVKENFRIDGIAFGDIYLQGHREWGEAVADSAGLQALYPLWTAQENAAAMLHHFVALGFSAKVIKVDETKLPTCWIGRLLDMELIGAILTKDVCPMGESGEYHTHVYDGPIFNKSN
jgi:uncharacterized protein (TIGR00290 family)